MRRPLGSLGLETESWAFFYLLGEFLRELQKALENEAADTGKLPEQLEVQGTDEETTHEWMRKDVPTLIPQPTRGDEDSLQSGASQLADRATF